MQYNQQFDVIVIGGGHAGTEAALAAARMGVATLLLTHNIETIGQMSCNPAVGGIGKGHLVREIDAMGGAMAEAADRGGIQMRTLNRSKGPAVRSTRAQADRVLYKAAIRAQVEHQPNLSLFQQAVDDLIIEGDRVVGVTTQMGLQFRARTVILTVGTFLGGLIHIGDSNFSGGRAGDPPSIPLAQRLREMAFKVDRLKTGTPPRIDNRSIDFSCLEEQPGDDPAPVFSLRCSHSDQPRQVPCHITYTNQNTHDLIEENIKRSPMFSGAIEGVGPRYCPSIEDKIVRFADKDSHQIFIEPEGLNATEVYPNGISTSLPFDVQYQFVRSIKGFENAHITRPGYAIEYDFFDPRDLKPSLQTRFVEGLFFAGQINGTTGYEEAGAQGLLAGINAALEVQEKDSWTPRRDEAYLGVMVDDLITRGTLEPYRMFTSRAEHRLLLREDNADLRLMPKAREFGLIGDDMWKTFEHKREAVELEKQRLHETFLRPEQMDAVANAVIKGGITREYRLEDLIRRPDVSYDSLMTIPAAGPAVENKKVAEQVEVQIKYSGYIERQKKEIEKALSQQGKMLPEAFDYLSIRGLSSEVREKLDRQRPQTIGHASRIPGVTPAAISLLLIHLKKKKMAS